MEEGASLAITNCAFERNWGYDGGAVDAKASWRSCHGSESCVAASSSPPTWPASSLSPRRMAALWTLWAPPSPATRRA